MRQDDESISAKVRRVPRKTRKILQYFQNQEYVYSVAKDLRMSYNGVNYHVEKLKNLGLIEKTGETEGKTFYKITEDGEIVLDRVNTERLQ